MTTLIGTLTVNGDLVNGTMYLELSQQAFAAGGVNVSPTSPYAFTLVNGAITAPGAAPYTVYGNDVLTPTSTFYRLTVYNLDNGQILRGSVYITGATQDIGAFATASTQTWVAPTGYAVSLIGDCNGLSTSNTNTKLRGKTVKAPPWNPGEVLTIQADQSIAPEPLPSTAVINSRVAVKKEGALVGTRRAINLYEGPNVTLSVTDNPGDEEVDVTITAAGLNVGSAETIICADPYAADRTASFEKDPDGRWANIPTRTFQINHADAIADPPLEWFWTNSGNAYSAQITGGRLQVVHKNNVQTYWAAPNPVTAPYLGLCVYGSDFEVMARIHKTDGGTHNDNRSFLSLHPTQNNISEYVRWQLWGGGLEIHTHNSAEADVYHLVEASSSIQVPGVWVYMRLQGTNVSFAHNLTVSSTPPTTGWKFTLIDWLAGTLESDQQWTLGFGTYRTGAADAPLYPTGELSYLRIRRYPSLWLNADQIREMPIEGHVFGTMTIVDSYDLGDASATIDLADLRNALGAADNQRTDDAASWTFSAVRSNGTPAAGTFSASTAVTVEGSGRYLSVWGRCSDGGYINAAGSIDLEKIRFRATVSAGGGGGSGLYGLSDNKVPYFDSATGMLVDSAISDVSGAIGVGTDAPTQPLDVVGGMRLRPAGDVTTSNGTVWSEPIQNSLKTVQKGVTGALPLVPFLQYGDVTVTNTEVETTLSSISSLGQLLLPEGFLKVGKTIRITVLGYVGAAAGTDPGSTISFKISDGFTTFTASASSVMINPNANLSWSAEFTLTVRTEGAPGTAVGQGLVRVGTTLYPISLTSAQNIDTTVDNTIDVTWTFGAGVTAAESITCTNLFVEVLG